MKANNLQQKRRKIMDKQRCLSNNLPQDIMFDILSRIPVKSLIKFRSVSHPWYDLVLDPIFSRLHSHYQSNHPNITHKLILTLDNKLYSLSYQNSCKLVEIHHPRILRNCSNIRIWGSCNGLVLLAVGQGIYDCTLYVWNPCTAVYREIPYCQGGYSGRGTVYGFGHNSRIDDYEIVRVTWHSGNDWIDGRQVNNGQSDDRSYVVVFSLRENRWRSCQGFVGKIKENCAGEFVNGCLHWVTVKNTAAIITFGIGCQEFSEVKLPTVGLDFALIKVTSYMGKLCVLYGKNNMLDAWVMNKYGVSDSWTKQFQVRAQLEFHNISDVVFCFTSKGLVLKKEDGTVVTCRKYRCLGSNGLQMVTGARFYKQSLVGLANA